MHSTVTTIKSSPCCMRMAFGLCCKVHPLTLTSTGSSGETTSVGSVGKENLDELFFCTFISCICMFPGDILQEAESELFLCFHKTLVYSYVHVPLSASHLLPVDIDTDLIRINDGRLSVQLLIIQQSTLNIVYPSQKKICNLFLKKTYSITWFRPWGEQRNDICQYQR